MQKSILLSTLILSSLICSSPLFAQSISKTDIYIWVDANGVKNYTDDKKKAPSGAQKKTVEVFIPPKPVKTLLPVSTYQNTPLSKPLTPPLSLPPLPEDAFNK